MGDVAVLLPGWGTSPRRFDRLRAELAVRDVATVDHAVQPDGLVDVLARRTRHVLRDLAERGHRVHVVGHSLGGLVAAWAATELEQGALASVTTVNTPWRGTWLAWTGTGALAAQLRWGSDDIACLRARVASHLEEPRGPRWLVVGAIADLGTPPTTSLRVGAGAGRLDRRLLPLAGHSVALETGLLARSVARHVAAANDDARPAGPRVRQVVRGGGEGI